MFARLRSFAHWCYVWCNAAIQQPEVGLRGLPADQRGSLTRPLLRRHTALHRQLRTRVQMLLGHVVFCTSRWPARRSTCCSGVNLALRAAVEKRRTDWLVVAHKLASELWRAACAIDARAHNPDGCMMLTLHSLPQLFYPLFLPLWFVVLIVVREIHR